MSKMSDFALRIEQIERDCGPVSTLYRTHLKTNKIDTVWWSPNRREADLSFGQMLEDATRITRRDASENATVSLEAVTANSDGATSSACDILNGLSQSAILIKVDIELGGVVEFDRANGKGSKTPVVLSDVEWPTDQYRQWYAWLRAEPAMYHLCISANTSKKWQNALALCNVRMPRHVAIHLWKYLRGMA